MSVLETPRILFRGQIAWDPIVTNNYPKFYNEQTSESRMPPASSTQLRVAGFRQQAVAAVPGGNWNPHGTHRSTFFETEVSGVDTGVGVDTGDPMVGTPVSFTGMLVDCEPFGAFTSQLFFDSMSFGIPGGCQVTCRRTSRVVARYINFSRNSYNRMIAGVASVVWQTSFAKADVLALDPSGSPALEALGNAMTDVGVLGLTVRWNSYRTIYYGDPTLTNGAPQASAAAKELVRRLGSGGWQPNPARSLVVGVLGLWRDGEPAQEPGDRVLLSQGPGEVVASAHARLSGQSLTIDLANSISETDDVLTKQDLGTLDVVAVAADGKTVVAQLGSLSYHQYDRNTYETGAGIVTLDLDAAGAAAAAGNDIQVRAGDDSVYLAEQALRPLPTEHNRYFDEGDAPTKTAVQLYDRGEPAAAGVDVTMYDMTGQQPVFAGTVPTGSNGVAAFPIAPHAGGGGGVTSYVFVAEPGPPPAQLDPQLTPYMYVRTLPAKTAIGSLPPTWDNVYTGVLANWNAMAPCMDNWLRLDDPVQVKAYAAVLKRLTDPANVESFLFMPVTRDMAAGERTLLWNFLDAPDSPAEPEASEVAPAHPAEAAPAEASEGPPQRDLSKLSRSMRSPQD